MGGELDASRGPSWRISVATVESKVEFSRYENTDRLLMPLDRRGLDLVIDGHEHHLPQYQVLAFPGELAISVRKLASPRKDLNVIFDRHRVTATLRYHYVVGSVPPPVPEERAFAVGVALSSTIRVDGSPLNFGDAFVLDDEPRGTLSGYGSMAIAHVRIP